MLTVQPLQRAGAMSCSRVLVLAPRANPEQGETQSWSWRHWELWASCLIAFLLGTMYIKNAKCIRGRMLDLKKAWVPTPSLFVFLPWAEPCKIFMKR